MRKVFLKIFDFFEKNRALQLIFLAVITLLLVVLSSRINYEEDISKFLPNNSNRKQLSKSVQQLASQKTIAVFFSNRDSSDQQRIMEAMQTFGDIVYDGNMVENLAVTVDQTQILDVIDAVYQHIPYFLDENDYKRIDSLLKTPHFIENQLVENKKILILPTSGTFARTLAYDPLHLFSPALQKLENLKFGSSFQTIDDYLFTDDGKYGIVTFETPNGANESKNNALLSDYIDKVLSDLKKQYPDIEAVAVGTPLIAVGNARQIKRDSLLAVAIAVALIFLILILHYRRISDIFWVGFSIFFGILFAIGGMAVFKDSVSVIVIGMGSVIIGIAANYPLHFLDEYKEVGERREAVREMVLPLLIGNLTTVAAFFCIVWLDARAMRDLGLFGSLMLIGTILFVLVFLPHFIRKRPNPSEHRLFSKISDKHLSRSRFSPYIALIILILTVFFGYFSQKTSFDSDLSHINYMTAEQRERMQLLSQIQSSDMIYAVAQGDDLETAAKNNSLLINKLKSSGQDFEIRGIGTLLPDGKAMKEAAGRWSAFWQDASKRQFVRDFENAANRQGFSITAFYPFTSSLSNTYETDDIESLNDFIQPFIGKYVFIDENGCKIISHVRAEDNAALHEVIDNEGDGFFIFSNEDIGNRLVEMLRDSFNYIGIVCSVVVFVFLLISFRKIELAVLAFLPLAVAWFWILGIMHISGIQFNIVNIILATFIFGQGDDYTLFITEGLLYEHTTGKPRLASYKHSVFISALIMFAGIGCLIVAKHPALKSLATVTIIGMLTVVVMASFIPPLIFEFLTKKSGKERFAPVTLRRVIISALYYIGFFFVTFVFLQPYAFFLFLFGKDTEEKKLKLHKTLRKWAGFFTKHAPGVRYTLRNEAGEDFSKPAVIISNHQSHIDIVTILSLSPKIVFLTNDNVWKNPFYGYILRKAECYPVSNGFDDNLSRLRDLYGRGYSICIFPEGTRSETCEILRFHKGAFALARELGADILPLLIHGPGHVMPKGEVLLCEGRTTLLVGKRSKPYNDFADEEPNEADRLAARKMRKHYSEKYEELRRELETPEYWKNLDRYRNYYKIEI